MCYICVALICNLCSTGLVWQYWICVNSGIYECDE